jgi:hypothetical protein
MPMRYSVGPLERVPRLSHARTGAGDRPVHDVGDVGNRQQRDLRAVEGAAAGRGAGLGLGAAGFLLLVVRAGGLVQQFGDFGGFHGVPR